MKVGIYTLPLNYNYGGLLQAYALQTVLERMGHDVTIIDRSLHQKESIWKHPREKSRRLFRKYILNRNNIRVFQENYEATVYPIVSQNTQKFIDQYLHVITTSDTSELHEGSYEAIVVGSDQIWRRAFHNSKKKCYDSFLAFAENWKIKRIAYAASFGVDYWEYNDVDTKRCAELAKLFDAVSVREEAGVNLCYEHLGVKAGHVLDPTMLLQKEDYIRLFEAQGTPQSSGNLLCYILDETPFATEVINTIEQRMGLHRFHVNSRADNTWAPVEDRIQPSVEQWLRGFYDAEYVVTDSFHACVFSILFGKPFIVLGNQNRGMERFRSLLRMVDLEDRLLKNGTLLDAIPQSSMSDALNIIKSLKDSSIQYLIDNIQ